MTHTTIRHAILGLDIGQSQDPCAAALLLHVEQISSPHSWVDATHPRSTQWQLAATKIFPLDTAYTTVAEQLYTISRRIKLQHPRTPLTLIADATGVGRSTLEILHREFFSHGPTSPARLEGLVFTGGASVTESRHPSISVPLFHVPKLDLLQTLLQAIESTHLQPVPNLLDRHILEAQLKSLRYTQSRLTGQTTVEVAHSATNPGIANADLVMALAMATWRMKSLYPLTPHQPPARLPGF